MKVRETKLNILLIVSVFTVAVGGMFVVNKVEAADNGNTTGYAWMEGYGYVHLSGASAPVDYGVTATDSGLSGYAWSEKLGWINFDDAGSLYAVTNDPAGNLCGYAWSEKIGYISFCDKSANKFYAVNVDVNGVFSGYAWSEKVGYINMDDAGSLYGVVTTWGFSIPNVSPIIFKKGIILKRDVILK
ncbi:MAG: hypothetical protein U9P50_01565 [Patescibacteria group bacterium]|nr:hypothetical protein [Patescibacteria group bacterium]